MILIAVMNVRKTSYLIENEDNFTLEINFNINKGVTYVWFYIFK